MPVTHKLVNEEQDEIIQFLLRRNLLNREEDKVKIVYHPDFINSPNQKLPNNSLPDCVVGCGFCDLAPKIYIKIPPTV